MLSSANYLMIMSLYHVMMPIATKLFNQLRESHDFVTHFGKQV